LPDSGTDLYNGSNQNLEVLYSWWLEAIKSRSVEKLNHLMVSELYMPAWLSTCFSAKGVYPRNELSRG